MPVPSPKHTAQVWHMSLPTSDSGFHAFLQCVFSAVTTSFFRGHQSKELLQTLPFHLCQAEITELQCPGPFQENLQRWKRSSVFRDRLRPKASLYRDLS